MKVPDWADVPINALPGSRFLLSPHHSRAETLEEVRYIVLHGTGSGSSGYALMNMMDSDNPAKPSAHCLITEVGEIIWLVPLNLVAWHAGRSGWAGQDELNPISIGIELQNPGKVGGYPRYTLKTVEALIKVLSYLLPRYNLPPSVVLGHSDVAPHRKEDPFHTFPWKVLEEVGLAATWLPNPKNTLWGAVMNHGYRYGPGRLEKGLPYGHSLRKQVIDPTDREEVTARYILLAFQRRFGLPLTGEMDDATMRFIRPSR